MRRLETVPLSVLTEYYRRNLSIPAGSAPSRISKPGGRCHDVRIPVAETSGDELRSGTVTVTVVQFAAHVAYLEPATGMGFLEAPAPGADISVPEDWLTGDPWLEERDECPTAGLSLHAADRTSALQLLADSRWTLLQVSGRTAQFVGRSAEGGPVVCLYADRTTCEQLVMEDFHRAFTALCGAAELRPSPGDR